MSFYSNSREYRNSEACPKSPDPIPKSCRFAIKLVTCDLHARPWPCYAVSFKEGELPAGDSCSRDPALNLKIRVPSQRASGL
jgi:hypothetical protein